MLPLLRGWSYYTMDVSAPGFEVPAGKKKVLAEANKPGWGIGGSIQLNHKLATFELELYDPYQGRQIIRMQPAGMYAGGAVTPNPLGPWLSVYDEASNNYVIILSPWLPAPYATRWVLSVTAPPDSPVRVVSMHGGMINIEDRGEFLASFREVMGVTTLEAVREVLRITGTCRTVEVR